MSNLTVHISADASAAVLAMSRSELELLEVQLTELDREIEDRRERAQRVRERMHFLQDRIAACDHAEASRG